MTLFARFISTGASSHHNDYNIYLSNIFPTIGSLHLYLINLKSYCSFLLSNDLFHMQV